MENSFDIQLVEQFVAAIREKGASVLSSSPFPFSKEQLSTPALAWLFSHRNALPAGEAVTKVLDLDVQRQKAVVGHNVFKEPRIETYPEEEAIHQQALLIIKTVWPDFFDIIQAIQPRVSFQTEDREKFESESDPKTFGEIIFNMKNRCPVHWAEILVHEVAHHYLTILLGTTQIAPETKSKFKEQRHSHQRKSERPLIGITHGIFAQSCILLFAAKVLLNNSLREKWGEGAQKTFDRYAPIFPNDLKTVEENQLLFHPKMRELSRLAKQQVESVNLAKGAAA